MSYMGSWNIDDVVTFYAQTHRFDTGNATDADSVPSYRVYENETTAPLLTGSMALLDSSNTAGYYSEQITLSAANGFEDGKCYCIRIEATVNSVVSSTLRTLQINARVQAVLTATERTSIAEAHCKFDTSTVSGEAALSPINAYRFMLGLFEIVTGGPTNFILKVYKNKLLSSLAWESNVTRTDGNPISKSQVQ